jgi:predicted RNase H-like HicB family nuclease
MSPPRRGAGREVLRDSTGIDRSVSNDGSSARGITTRTGGQWYSASGMTTYHFPVVIEKDDEGYFAYCPALQGCHTQGTTYEEVLERLKDAIRLHVEDRVAAGEEIPQPDSVSLTSLDIAV